MEDSRKEQSADDRPRTEDKAVSRRKSGRPDRTPYATIAEAKRLYLHTAVPVSEICALLGIEPHALHYRRKKWGWPMRSKLIPEEEPAECAAIGGFRALANDPASPFAALPDAERRALLTRLNRRVKAETAALDALFPRALIERSRVAEAPALARIVVAIDPPVSSREGADACGLVAAGLGADGRLYVLADNTAWRLTPLEWASRAVTLYRKLEADRIVVEVNQGGEMARVVIAEVDASVPVTAVRATRNKRLRAEPVAALYEQGRVSHVGAFPALEDEMAEFGPDGLLNGRSPDRLDALVWAITHLALSTVAAPRVRGL